MGENAIKRSRMTKVRTDCIKIFWLIASILLLHSGYAVGQTQSANTFCETYTVASGDSALSIAQKFQVDYEVLVAALQDCIGYVDGTVLQIGQRACIPPYSPSCKFVSTTGDDGTCKYYTVQYGDTLANVASSFSTDLADLAKLNGLNLNTTVVPQMKLALPPWDKNCPDDILPKVTSPPPDSSECKIYISNGGESLDSIAGKYSVTLEALLQVNSNYTTDKKTEPGDQIKLPPWSDTCRDNATVVNRPVSSESVEIPVVVMAPTAAESEPVQVVVPSAGEFTDESATIAPPPAELPEVDSKIDLGKLIVDVYLKGISSQQFKEKEALYLENVASASNVSTQYVEVRFALSVQGVQSRKLLSESLLKIDTAILGNETQNYDNFATSVAAGEFQESMNLDGFDVFAITAAYPDGENNMLYNASSNEASTQSDGGSSLPLPLGALIGIAAGGAVLLILVVTLCCICNSQRKKKAMLKAEEMRNNQRRREKSFQEGVSYSKGRSPSRHREINIEAFSGHGSFMETEREYSIATPKKSRVSVERIETVEQGYQSPHFMQHPRSPYSSRLGTHEQRNALSPHQHGNISNISDYHTRDNSSFAGSSARKIPMQGQEISAFESATMTPRRSPRVQSSRKSELSQYMEL